MAQSNDYIFTIGEVTHRSIHYSITPVNRNIETIEALVVEASTNDTLYFEYAEPGNSPYDRDVFNYVFSGLKVNTEYVIVVTAFDLNGEQRISKYPVTTLQDWVHDGVYPQISFVTGSCAYINDPETDRPGNGYGGGYEIYDAMLNEDVDFNLWLGDNLYYRPSDVSDDSGLSYRYKTSFSHGGKAKLLADRPNLAIWDDHDVGPNNSTSAYMDLSSTIGIFQSFWARRRYGAHFDHSHSVDNRWVSQYGDVVVIGLDNRTYRTSEHSNEPQILGKDQIDWFLNTIEMYKRSSFIIVAFGGQVLNSAQVYENYAQYPEELSYLMEGIQRTGYSNLVFFTGDRHHSELSRVDLDSVRILDFTVSPLTSGISTVAEGEQNDNRVGEAIIQRNYAVVEITGGRGERTLKVTYKDVNGDEISSHEFKSM